MFHALTHIGTGSTLMLGSGLFWTLTYILIIRRGFLDQTYGVPLVALCTNISWEFIFSFVYPPRVAQHIVNIIWFSLDAIIFFTLLRTRPLQREPAAPRSGGAYPVGPGLYVLPRNYLVGN